MIGHVLRERRHELGMSLRVVADRANISFNFLSELERGKKPFSSEVIGSLCKALDVPLHVMLYEVCDLLEGAEKGENYVAA